MCTLVFPSFYFKMPNSENLIFLFLFAFQQSEGGTVDHNQSQHQDGREDRPYYIHHAFLPIEGPLPVAFTLNKTPEQQPVDGQNNREGQRALEINHRQKVGKVILKKPLNRTTASLFVDLRKINQQRNANEMETGKRLHNTFMRDSQQKRRAGIGLVTNGHRNQSQVASGNIVLTDEKANHATIQKSYDFSSHPDPQSNKDQVIAGNKNFGKRTTPTPKGTSLDSEDDTNQQRNVDF